jgi:hypothetical protein
LTEQTFDAAIYSVQGSCNAFFESEDEAFGVGLLQRLQFEAQLGFPTWFSCRTYIANCQGLPVCLCLIPVLSQTVPIQLIPRTKVQTKNKGGRPKQVSCGKLLRLVPPSKISLSSYAAAAAAAAIRFLQ